MAYTDPQSLTIATVATDFPRVGFGMLGSKFTTADGENSLELSHQMGSRYRHLARLTDSRIVSNPLVPDQNLSVNMSAHIVVDMPRNGYTAAEVANLAAALSTWATEANLLKLISGES
jgi:hypothetical protein